MRWLVVVGTLGAAALGITLPLEQATSTAWAVPRGCAMVAGTPDGFLAIRAGPSPDYPEIERLKPGQMVLAAAPSSLHPWLEVDVLVEITNGKPRVVRDLHGYAHGRYLKRVDC